MDTVLDSSTDLRRIFENKLFAGIPTELLERILPRVGVREVNAGEVIFEEGEPGDCLYLIYEGAVRISKEGRGGRQEALDFMHAGDFFGEMALVDGQPRSARAAAAERCVLVRVDRPIFEEILALAPRELHLNFLKSVVQRLRGVDSHYIEEVMRSERLSLVGSMANSIIHDLKNPIHCIRGAAELLSLKVNRPEVRDLFRIIHQSSNRMLDMIQELLDFARGQSSVQLERRSVQDALLEVNLQIGPLIPSNVQLCREGGDCAAEILVDSGRFSRMLLNLVKNAVEAMPQGGTVTFAVEERDGSVAFRVTDTGCGIAPEKQAEVFEPFVTFGKAKGTGLGLPIAKTVVEAHGGTIALSSRLGVGTTMEVTLPLAPASAT